MDDVDADKYLFIKNGQIFRGKDAEEVKKSTETSKKSTETSKIYIKSGEILQDDKADDARLEADTSEILRELPPLSYPVTLRLPQNSTTRKAEEVRSLAPVVEHNTRPMNLISNVNVQTCPVEDYNLPTKDEFAKPIAREQEKLLQPLSTDKNQPKSEVEVVVDGLQAEIDKVSDDKDLKPFSSDDQSINESESDSDTVNTVDSDIIQRPSPYPKRKISDQVYQVASEGLHCQNSQQLEMQETVHKNSHEQKPATNLLSVNPTQEDSKPDNSENSKKCTIKAIDSKLFQRDIQSTKCTIKMTKPSANVKEINVKLGNIDMTGAKAEVSTKLSAEVTGIEFESATVQDSITTAKASTSAQAVVKGVSLKTLTSEKSVLALEAKGSLEAKAEVFSGNIGTSKINVAQGRVAVSASASVNVAKTQVASTNITGAEISSTVDASAKARGLDVVVGKADIQGIKVGADASAKAEVTGLDIKVGTAKITGTEIKASASASASMGSEIKVGNANISGFDGIGVKASVSAKPGIKAFNVDVGLSGQAGVRIAPAGIEIGNISLRPGLPKLDLSGGIGLNFGFGGSIDEGGGGNGGNSDVGSSSNDSNVGTGHSSDSSDVGGGNVGGGGGGDDGDVGGHNGGVGNSDGDVGGGNVGGGGGDDGDVGGHSGDVGTGDGGGNNVGSGDVGGGNVGGGGGDYGDVGGHNGVVGTGDGGGNNVGSGDVEGNGGDVFGGDLVGGGDSDGDIGDGGDGCVAGDGGASGDNSGNIGSHNGGDSVEATDNSYQQAAAQYHKTTNSLESSARRGNNLEGESFDSGALGIGFHTRRLGASSHNNVQLNLMPVENLQYEDVFKVHHDQQRLLSVRSDEIDSQIQGKVLSPTYGQKLGNQVLHRFSPMFRELRKQNPPSDGHTQDIPKSREESKSFLKAVIQSGQKQLKSRNSSESASHSEDHQDCETETDEKMSCTKNHPHTLSCFKKEGKRPIKHHGGKVFGFGN